MKNTAILSTENKEWGFWGTSVRNGYDAELTWDAASCFLAKEFDLTAEQTRDVLDARFGRHLADDLSFIENGKGNAKGPISADAITKHLKARMADQGWRDSFENAIREVTGKTFPRKVPMTKDELFTQIAQQHLNIETLVERKSDSLDFHDVAVWSVRDALEAAYCAAQNVNSAWNPRQPCRSVSVGDVLKLAEQHYVVAPVGFVALPAVTDAPSRRGFVIVHRDDGIYLGNALGLGFFSKLDPVGQNQAVAFDSIQAATEHLSSWAIAEESDMQAYQFVEVLLNSNGCATIEACVKAGLESWDPAQ